MKRFTTPGFQDTQSQLDFRARVYSLNVLAKYWRGGKAPNDISNLLSLISLRLTSDASSKEKFL